MKTENTCANCRFFRMDTAVKLAKPAGVCRRYPPTATAIGVPQRDLTGDFKMGITPIMVRPTVEASDFCGEHTVDLLVRS